MRKDFSTHSKKIVASAKQKYLVVKGCAGLGNRLVTVLAAIQYCIRNNRTLVIDWADGQFEETGVNAFDKCFELVKFSNYTTINAIANWNELTHSSELFKTNKYKGVYDLYTEKQNYSLNRIPQWLLRGAMKKCRKRWVPIGGKGRSLFFGSDLPDNLSFDVAYFVDFLPQIPYSPLPDYVNVKPCIFEKIDAFKNTYQLENAIGVHVRATDKRPQQQVDVLVAHLHKIANKRRIFLSTDSTAIEAQFRAVFADVITYSKTKPELSGEGLHQWALYKKEEKMKYVLFEESVMDMFLLSHCCELLYQGNSTFSKISSVYHRYQPKCRDWQKLTFN